MGGFSALNISAKALQAFQYAIQTIGHNISNAETEGYSRQRVNLVASQPDQYTFGSVGTGVDVNNVQRIRDSYLDVRMRRESAELGKWEAQQDALESIELYFNEPSDSGLSSILSGFWEGWESLSNSPENEVNRASLLQQSELLVSNLNTISAGLSQIRQNLDENIRTKITQVNTLASQIATLNGQIVQYESGGGSANDLRDQRDALTNELGGLVNITTYEQQDGAYSINIGGKMLVWGTTSTDLETDADETDPLNISNVVWSDTGKEVRITTGEMYGVLEARDTVLPKYIDKLDTLVAGLITEVNAVHSQGWGLNGYSAMTSSYAVTDASAALGSAGSGLDFYGQLQAGTLNINAIDSSGGVHTFDIAITSATTLNGAVPADNLVNLINSDAGNAGYVTASADASGHLVLTAASGYTFTVTDSSASPSRIGVALGLNNYFTGADASDIAVNPLFDDEPDKVSAAASYSSGDNTNALAIAALRDSNVMLGDTVTIEGYYQTEIVGALGVELDQANSMVDNQDMIVSQISNSMDEVSGVSLDEEMASLVQFQHSYEAAAKYMVLVQEMLQSLIDII